MASRFLRLTTVVGFWVVVTSVWLSAQTGASSITGRVIDEGGGVVPGVTITITNEETGAARTAITGGAGRYTAPNMPAGRYTLRAELPGFSTFVRSGVTLTVGRDILVNMELKVGEVTEEVFVTGEAPLVETAGSTISGLVGEQEMTDLPLNGRSFDQLITLDSAAANFTGFTSQGTGHGFGQKFTVGGMRWESNKFYQDGMERLGAAKGGDTPGSASGLQLGVDAIREFRLLTNNYSAEYGKKAGAAVVTVTKSGTNQIHGSAFAFHRNDNLDAAKWEDTARGGGVKPEFKRNNFGGSVGGALKQDKMFFFTNYEGVRERLGTNQIAIVPDENARMGILPGVDDPIPVNPVVVPYLALYPLPTGQNFADGTAEVASPASRATTEDFLMGRFDSNISESDSFFLSLTTSAAKLVAPEDLPLFADNTETRNYTASLEWTHIFSPRLLHVAGVGFDRAFFLNEGRPQSALDPSLDFTPGAGFGEIDFQTNITTLGQVNALNEITNNTFQFSERFLYSTGSHSLKAGWQIQRIRRNEIPTLRQRGTHRFGSLEDFLAGEPNRFTGIIPGDVRGATLNLGLVAQPNFRKGWRQTYGGFYVQDSWKATPTFSVDAGLRFEFATAPDEVDGKTHRWLVDKLVPEGLFLQTTPVLGKPVFDHTSTGLGPRLGLAWDPKGDGRTVIRVGGGMFFEQLDNKFRFFMDASPPFTARAQFSGEGDVPFPRPFEGRDASELTIEGRGVDPNAEKATVFHYNLGVQQELFSDLALKVAYAGSKGYHLSNQVSANLRPAVILPDGRKHWPNRRGPFANPILGAVNILNANSNSWYNSLRVELEKRFGSGGGTLENLRFKWAYTFAKSIDHHSVNQNSAARNGRSRPLDSFDLEREKALSNFDLRHNVTFNFGYGLPRFYSGGGFGATLLNDWSINGILTGNTGHPAGVEVGTNRSQNGESSVVDRPDLVPGGDTNPVLGGPDEYFDFQDFLFPGAGFHGNLGRNTLIMPGLVTFDFSLVKAFPLSERFGLQFRSEFFNLFNRPNFGAPAKRLFNSRGKLRGSVGRISNTVTTARQIQFGLRLEF